MASCGRCHKPQDVERHLSPSPPTRACTRARARFAACMSRQGQTLITGLEELPGAACNLLTGNLTNVHGPGWIERLTGRSKKKKKVQPFVYGRACVGIIFSLAQLSCGLLVTNLVCGDVPFGFEDLKMFQFNVGALKSVDLHQVSVCLLNWGG